MSHTLLLKQWAGGIQFETLPSNAVNLGKLNIKKYSGVKREDDFTLMHIEKLSANDLVQLMYYCIVIRNPGPEITFKIISVKVQLAYSLMKWLLWKPDDSEALQSASVTHEFLAHF